MTFVPLLVPLLSIWSEIGKMFGALMEPLYTAVSAVLVFWHMLFSPIFGRDSGVTWILSIIFLTFVIRTLMIPLFVKTIQSSRNMQLIQPKLQELQKKYGADRERLGQETMKLYREEGVNPMSSCLPLLIQMPIFWALYQTLAGVSAQPHPQPHGYFLQHNEELVQSLRGATFLGAQLSGRFLSVGVDGKGFAWAGFGPTQIMAALLIVAMSAVLFITQLHMTRKNMTPEALTGPFAQQQKMMLYMFPIMYLFMGVSIPVGVLVYWLTTNLWTLVQQWIMITAAPAPNTPAYLDWEEKMRRKGKDPREIERKRAEKRAARRPSRPVASDEPITTVQRQTVQRQGSRPVARQGRSSASSEDTLTPTIVRQQPRKVTRSVRRK